MQKLGISAGDSIEIVGKRTTSVIAWPAYSEDQDRVEGTTIEEETEREAISKAKEQAKTKSESLTVYVDLKEKRGDIGSFKWAKVKPDGTVDYIYPEGWHRICPYCGEPLTAYYGRYYCHKCNKYL
jgi:hypothetical protein